MAYAEKLQKDNFDIKLIVCREEAEIIRLLVGHVIGKGICSILSKQIYDSLEGIVEVNRDKYFSKLIIATKE